MKELYRSQKLYKEVKDKDFEVFPICVPSYNRPNPVILDSLDTYPELPFILFIRNDPEQKKMYKHLKKKCKIVLLDDVHNIGQTRKAIIEWCKENKIPQIFMMDDDIDELDFLYPHKTNNGTVCMRAARQNMGRPYKGVNPFTLRMWMRMIEESRKDLTISAPAYRPDSWHMKNKDADVVYNNGSCIQCIHINVKNLAKKGLNYRDTDECGNEDYALQFDVMSSGLTTCVFHDLMYGCPAVGSKPGGCENASGIADVKERYNKYIELFLKNVSGYNHEGVKVKNTRSSALNSIKFDWKYWKKEEE